MTNISLIKVKKEVDQRLVEQVEVLSTLVSEGKVSGIAIALTFYDGNTGSGYYTPNLQLMLGSLKVLEREILDNHIE